MSAGARRVVVCHKGWWGPGISKAVCGEKNWVELAEEWRSVRCRRCLKSKPKAGKTKEGSK